MRHLLFVILLVVGVTTVHAELTPEEQRKQQVKNQIIKLQVLIPYMLDLMINCELKEECIRNQLNVDQTDIESATAMQKSLKDSFGNKFSTMNDNQKMKCLKILRARLNEPQTNHNSADEKECFPN